MSGCARSIKRRRLTSKTKRRKCKSTYVIVAVATVIVALTINICIGCWINDLNRESLYHAKAAKEFLDKVGFTIVGGTATAFLTAALSAWNNKKKQNNWPTIAVSGMIAVIISIVMLGSSTIILYAKTQRAIADYNYNKENTKIENGEQAEEDKPVRNNVEFVWEEDPFVEDLGKYYTGTISEEEKEEYVLRLIQEYLGDSQTIPEGYFDELGDYNGFIGQANDYNDAFDAEHALEVQKTQRENERNCRISADQCYRNSENRMLIGNTENELAKIEMQLEINGWEKHYENALFYYIKGLVCAIREEKAGIYMKGKAGEVTDSVEMNWEHIMDSFETIKWIQDSNADASGTAEMMRDVCERIDIEQYGNKTGD